MRSPDPPVASARSGSDRRGPSGRNDLLGLIGVDLPVAPVEGDPVADWAASGAMALTGLPDGPPLAVAGPATALRTALAALQALAPEAVLPGVQLLGERAAIAGLTRQGRTSPGGGTRLLDAGDGLVAITLSREDDLAAVPALVEAAVDDPWDAVTRWAARTAATDVVERARLLGIPASTPSGADVPGPYGVTGDVTPQPPLHDGGPLVVDLSSLWAGPLCAHLLRLCGARVVTVESTRRPDGARRGPQAFHDLLRHGTQSVALDLTTPDGRRLLHELLLRADVVIEGSRPRALQQMGIDAEQVVAAPGDRTWVSLTAYGRTGPWSDRVGFGDDVTVAAGVLAPGPVLAGDALAGGRRGGSRLVDVSLVSVLSAARQPAVDVAARDTGSGWVVATPAGEVPVATPTARTPGGRAPDLGQHTDAVLHELLR
jgi:crotonobetainyl-CoA:carnitine CoA-transferase CaiB-like acyl-CoA transferase